jgi:hypothetical protein
MKLELIDSHCHLYVKAFESDRDDMIQRAVDAGVGQLFLPAIDKHASVGSPMATTLQGHDGPAPLFGNGRFGRRAGLGS